MGTREVDCHRKVGRDGARTEVLAWVGACEGSRDGYRRVRHGEVARGSTRTERAYDRQMVGIR